MMMKGFHLEYTVPTGPMQMKTDGVLGATQPVSRQASFGGLILRAFAPGGKGPKPYHVRFRAVAGSRPAGSAVPFPFPAATG